MGHGSFSPGNAEGGLTTLEEKSLGAYSKSGTGPIHGVVTPGQRIPGPGLYLLDVVPEGPPRWGFPNINDNAEIAELIACGAHLVLFTTGRGSVVGSAISPVVKICANPETYRRMSEDMDVDAGRILEGRAGIDEVAAELLDVIARDRGRPPDGERAPRAPRVRAHLQVERAGRPGLPADGSMTTRATFAGYERAALQPTVVHIGPGVFHRAHQAVYCDAVLRTGSPTGAVWGISLRSAAVRDALAPQGFVYHVVERAPEAGDAADVVRPVGALLGVDVAAHDVRGRPRPTDRRGGDRRDDHRDRARLLHRRPWWTPRSEPPRDRARPAGTARTPVAARPPPRGSRPPPRRRHRARSPSHPATTCRRTGRPPLGPSASSPSAATRRSPRGSMATSRSPRRWSTAWSRRRPPTTGTSCAATASSTPGRSSPSRSRNGCWRTSSQPVDRPGSERASSSSPTSPCTSRPSCGSSTPRTRRSRYWGLLAGHQLGGRRGRRPGAVRRDEGPARQRGAPDARRSARLGPLAAYAEQVLARFANRALGYTTAKVAADGSQKLPVRVMPTVRARLAVRRARTSMRAGARRVGDVHGRPSRRRLRRRGRRPLARSDPSRARTPAQAAPSRRRPRCSACRGFPRIAGPPSAPSAATSSSRSGGSGAAMCDGCSPPRPVARGPQRRRRRERMSTCDAPRHRPARAGGRDRSVASAAPLADALVRGGLAVRRGHAPHARRTRGHARRSPIARTWSWGPAACARAEQVDQAVEAGARFIVSPGLSDGVLDRCRDLDVPALPGVATADGDHARARRRPGGGQALPRRAPRRPRRRPQPGCPVPGHAVRAHRRHRPIGPRGVPAHTSGARRRRQLDGRARPHPVRPLRRDPAPDPGGRPRPPSRCGHERRPARRRPSGPPPSAGTTSSRSAR